MRASTEKFPSESPYLSNFMVAPLTPRKDKRNEKRGLRNYVGPLSRFSICISHLSSTCQVLNHTNHLKDKSYQHRLNLSDVIALTLICVILDNRLNYESAISSELLDRLIRLISNQLIQGPRVQLERIVEIRRINGHVLKRRLGV